MGIGAEQNSEITISAPFYLKKEERKKLGMFILHTNTFSAVTHARLSDAVCRQLRVKKILSSWSSRTVYST